jgi:hypothetical protein
MAQADALFRRHRRLSQFTVSLTGEGRPELIPGAQVSANLFDVLGVRPRFGRTFLEQEDGYGQHQVVILADSIWRLRFGAPRSAFAWCWERGRETCSAWCCARA